MHRRALVKSSWRVLVSGMLLVACGGEPGQDLLPSDDALGTQQSALCTSISVTQLSVTDISSYGGDAAGFGTWQVSTFSNAVRLDYYVDGVLRSSDERPGNSGSWYFSAGGITCGAHAFEVKAYPMVIDSNNNRTICWDKPRTLQLTLTQACPTATLSCTRSADVFCSGSGSGGTGGFTFFWQEAQDGFASGWFQGPATRNFFCPRKTLENPYNGELTVSFKVRDNSGMESPPISRTFLCAF